jgi:hypothetical protein
VLDDELMFVDVWKTLAIKGEAGEPTFNPQLNWVLLSDPWHDGKQILWYNT